MVLILIWMQAIPRDNKIHGGAMWTVVLPQLRITSLALFCTQCLILLAWLCLTYFSLMFNYSSFLQFVRR